RYVDHGASRAPQSFLARRSSHLGSTGVLQPRRPGKRTSEILPKRTQARIASSRLYVSASVADQRGAKPGLLNPKYGGFRRWSDLAHAALLAAGIPSATLARSIGRSMIDLRPVTAREAMKRWLTIAALIALAGCYELPGPPGELVADCPPIDAATFAAARESGGAWNRLDLRGGGFAGEGAGHTQKRCWQRVV